MKSVLYISYDGMTDPLGQSQVIPYMAGLARKGHRITILSCEKEANFREFEGRCRRIFDESSIEWHHVSYTKRPPVLSTYYDLERMHRLGARLAKSQRFDIVHCRSILPTLLGHRLSRRFGMKLIFDTRSFWTDERVEGNLWNLSNPIYRALYFWFKRKEARLYREADLLLTLTERAKEHIGSLDPPGPSSPPIHVVPCCADTDHFSPARVDADRAEHHRRALGLQGASFVLAYIGSLGTRYMLREMLELFAVILERNTSARFLFITRDEHAAIRASADTVGIPADAICIVPSTYEEIPELISLADASVFFIKTGISGKAVSPTKQAELMSMGLPIVCNGGIGDCDEIIGGTGAGVVLDELHPAAYAEATERHEKPGGLSPAEIRKVALSRLSLREGVERYHEAWESL